MDTKRKLYQLNIRNIILYKGNTVVTSEKSFVILVYFLPISISLFLMTSGSHYIEIMIILYVIFYKLPFHLTLCHECISHVIECFSKM